MIKYGIISETFILDKTIRKSYGIAAYACADSTDTYTVVATVNDISGDYDSVANLVKLCNEGGLSPDHLKDIAEDFLAVH